jgi:TetR/AcrR family transcriptional regulator, tetracycline repressor protein
VNQGPEVHERAHWGTLTREQIVDTAVEAVKAGRYEEMTIRSLAADLGVAPMTLYGHIKDRDDLLDEVTDRLLAECWRPRKDFDTWQQWIMEAARRFRRLLVNKPAVLHVFLSHPVASPAAIERMDAMLEVLSTAGFNEEEALRIYATLHTYTIGFAALEASRSKWESTSKRGDANMRQLSSFTTTGQFNIGLEVLLHGPSITK